jgi:hypothetical protein
MTDGSTKEPGLKPLDVDDLEIDETGAEQVKGGVNLQGERRNPTASQG